MKTNSIISAVVCLVLCMSICPSCSNPFDHNTSISVHETHHSYQFSASYDKNSTRKVQQYINRSTEPNGLFDSDEDYYFTANTSLEDGTKFYIKESPGKLEIKFDKQENSGASYNRIKKMCEGIKTILAGKQTDQ